MSAIEELQSAVATIAERVGPSIVGIGRGTRGSGVVIADGTVLTNAHNLRGEEVTVTFADGRRTAAPSPASTATATSRSSRSTPPGAAAVAWGDGYRAVDRHAGLRRRRLARRRQPRDVRPRVGGRSRVPRPGWPAHRRQRRAHRSPRPGLVGRRPRRCVRPARRPQHQPDRRGLLPRAARPTRRCASGSMRWPAASRRRGPVSAWRSPRRTWHGGCAARSACRSVTASWSVASRTAARPMRPASRRATSSSRPPARRSPMATTCFAALATVSDPYEVKLVRGAEERTVTVGASRRTHAGRRVGGGALRPRVRRGEARGVRAVASRAWSACSPGTRSPRRSGRSSRSSSPTPSRSSGSCSSAGASGRS